MELGRKCSENYIDWNRFEKQCLQKLYCEKQFPYQLSFPLTVLLIEKYSLLCQQDGLDKLNMRTAASLCFEASVTPCSAIVALLYLDRLHMTNPDYLQSVSPTNAFIVSLLIASKYLYDEGEVESTIYNWVSENVWPLSTLNYSELEFLDAIEWNLYFEPDEFIHVISKVEEEVAMKEVLRRGYCTYEELLVLFSYLPEYWSPLFRLGHVIVVCAVTYTAALSCVLGSVFCVVHLNTFVTQLTTECIDELTDVSLQVLGSLNPTWPLLLYYLSSVDSENRVGARLYEDNSGILCCNIDEEESDRLNLDIVDENISEWSRPAFAVSFSVSVSNLSHIDVYEIDELWIDWILDYFYYLSLGGMYGTGDSFGSATDKLNPQTCCLCHTQENSYSSFYLKNYIFLESHWHNTVAVS